MTVSKMVVFEIFMVPVFRLLRKYGMFYNVLYCLAISVIYPILNLILLLMYMKVGTFQTKVRTKSVNFYLFETFVIKFNCRSATILTFCKQEQIS